MGFLGYELHFKVGDMTPPFNLDSYYNFLKNCSNPQTYMNREVVNQRDIKRELKNMHEMYYSFCCNVRLQNTLKTK